MAEDNLFDKAAAPQDNDDVSNFLNKYVGEDKKYKSVEDLAKAYDHADRHISNLSGDLDSLKDFMKAQFEQMSNRDLRQPSENLPVEDKDHKPDPVAPPTGNGNEDLDSRIRKALDEADESKRLKTNAEFAQEVLIRQFGSQEDAVKAVQAKAAELGVNPQFIADTAFRSPQALFNLMGINPETTPRSPTTPGPSSDVNPRVLDKVNPNPKPNTYAYYDQLRKSDPNRYWSSSVQAQMMKDAVEQGSNFYRK